MSINNNNLTVEHLTVSYQGQKALYDISLHIPAGKITGVIGPNGAGKSTFLKGMLGLIKTDSRTVLAGEQPIDGQKKRIAYVEQRSALDLSFPINVMEDNLHNVDWK